MQIYEIHAHPANTKWGSHAGPEGNRQKIAIAKDDCIYSRHINATSPRYQHNLEYVNFFGKNIELENATFKVAKIADLSHLCVRVCIGG